jgi:hypothetical protein
LRTLAAALINFRRIGDSRLGSRFAAAEIDNRNEFPMIFLNCAGALWTNVSRAGPAVEYYTSLHLPLQGAKKLIHGPKACRNAVSKPHAPEAGKMRRRHARADEFAKEGRN